MADLSTAVGDLGSVTNLLESELANLKEQLKAAETVNPGVQSAADAIEAHVATLREAVNSIDPGVLAVPAGQTVTAGTALVAGSAGQAGQNPGTGSANPTLPVVASDAAAAQAPAGSVVTTGGGGVPIGATAVVENANAPVNTPTQEQTQAQSVTDPGSVQPGITSNTTADGSEAAAANAAGTGTTATPAEAGTGASSPSDSAVTGTPGAPTDATKGTEAAKAPADASKAADATKTA